MYFDLSHSNLNLKPESKFKTIKIGLTGNGKVANALLLEIKNHQKKWKDKNNLLIDVACICGRKKMWWATENKSLFEKEKGTQTWRPTNLTELGFFLGKEEADLKIMIDCSASDEVVEHYEEWMDQGLHIVAANKHGPSGNLNRWKSILEKSKKLHKQVLFETTVGAGLPILSSIAQLMETQDEFFEIIGIVSGTLGWIFNEYDGTQSFSSLVKKAYDMGLTEPDPREDLNGMDVVRKTVILARELEIPVHIEDVHLDSFLPDELKHLCLEEFWEKSYLLDSLMKEKIKNIPHKHSLKFVTHLNLKKKTFKVGLQHFPEKNPLCQTHLTDNIFCFSTRRYCNNPLIIQGPGAGLAVTTGGILGDIFKISQNFKNNGPI